MFKFYFNKQILAGFLFALAILSWLAVSSYVYNKDQVSRSQVIAHALEVLFNTERVLATAANIELGRRGFALTGDRKSLDSYNRSKREIGSCLAELRQLTRNNISQQQRIDHLQEAVDKLLEFSAAAITSMKEGLETSATLNASMEGKRLMDTLRTTIAAIESEENALLHSRNWFDKKQDQNHNNAFIGLIVTMAVILLVVFYAINVNLKGRIDTEQRLKVALAEVRDLYDNAPCGYHSLDNDGKFVDINNTLVTWLGYKKEEVLGKKKLSDVLPEKDLSLYYKSFEQFKKTGSLYNATFNLRRKDGSEIPVMLNAVAVVNEKGRYVRSRSITFDNTERLQAEVRIKNLIQELEAFAYSVSHDLRAPLRSIDGYSKILVEDYSDRLDAEGHRVISVIMNNARRMSKLIDDLLSFARVGRKDLSRSPLDMMRLVKSITGELLEHETDRKIDVRISTLLPAQGDIDMIRQVWMNLLSNAIKYTGRTSSASIEVSSSAGADEICYQVKDNGVGFDMKYIGKLFGVFQRLHKVEDFNGTGVGLAIVKRIVDRHGGRIWAEAATNEGATFYFTIPNDNGKQ